ncbi:ferredoxin reductase [Verminephrobacter aporrectodeae subsp. tuberculatae]|uniref:FAD-dependent oxidoreductase n=1 Tax=Verminephrobacter aporrectodeae TaxID=1110389 RepID=UPI00224415C2|nr:FAD-dependent oxidoreductase [Verminephrobacter aporrectodeae]MCW8196972.1 ferredoxin reductase [Verminephrobacter aporrectodeae subsp. tuberculatae]
MGAEPHIVIVGSGVAGTEAAYALRTFGHAGPITLLGREPHLPYERPPLSKAYLRGSPAREGLWLRPASAYAEERILLRTGTEVLSIDRAARELRLRTGDTLAYEQLLLATGGEPRALALPGADLPGVLSLKTLDDAERLRPRLVSGAAVVLIGGGYVGMELAATACQAGCKVTVVEGQSRVLARTLPAAIGAHLQDQHRARGVRLVLDAQIAALEGDTRVRAVRLADGERLPADTVLVGIGNHACDELAQRIGLATAAGIVVDAHGRTRDPAIFAAGDCAVAPQAGFAAPIRLESVQSARFQARRAAAAMRAAAQPVSVADELPWFWSDQFDTKLQMAGLPRPGDAQILRGDPASGSFSVVFQNAADGVTAVQCVNAASDFAAAKKLIAQRRCFDPAWLADAGLRLREIRDRTPCAVRAPDSSPTQRIPAMPHPVTIEATDRKGRVHHLENPPGSSLMEVLRARGLPVAATCGGARSCATCHVYVHGGYGSVGAPDEDELDLLTESEHYRAGESRLSCQIQLQPQTGRLQVELAPQD